MRLIISLIVLLLPVTAGAVPFTGPTQIEDWSSGRATIETAGSTLGWRTVLPNPDGPSYVQINASYFEGQTLQVRLEGWRGDVFQQDSFTAGRGLNEARLLGILGQWDELHTAQSVYCCYDIRSASGERVWLTEAAQQWLGSAPPAAAIHTPEPATWVLLASGLLGLWWFGRRQRRRT